MDKNEIWQKIERLLEKTEKSTLVAIDRADFEKALKNASDCAYIEIENAPLPDLLDQLRRESAILPMESVRNTVVRIGIPPAAEKTAQAVCTLLETIHGFAPDAALVWGSDEDPAILAGCYSIATVFASSAE